MAPRRTPTPGQLKRLANQGSLHGRRKATQAKLEKLAQQQHPRPKEDR